MMTVTDVEQHGANFTATRKKTKEHWQTRRSCETMAGNKLTHMVGTRVATKASVHGTHRKRLKMATTEHGGK